MQFLTHFRVLKFAFHFSHHAIKFQVRPDELSNNIILLAPLALAQTL